MTFREDAVALRVVPGYYFDRVSGGSDDDHGLLGRAKLKAAVAALGAEAYMSSVLLGETAYEAETGFIAKPIDPSCNRQSVVAAILRAGR